MIGELPRDGRQPERARRAGLRIQPAPPATIGTMESPAEQVLSGRQRRRRGRPALAPPVRKACQPIGQRPPSRRSLAYLEAAGFDGAHAHPGPRRARPPRHRVHTPARWP